MFKKEMMNRLRSSVVYKAALAGANKDDAARISSYVERWMESVLDKLEPVAKHVTEADDSEIEKLQRVAEGASAVVMNTSGSKE